jgi:hypothetical protein
MQDITLSKDELNALEQISEMRGRPGKPSACVARNTKRLAGLKFISYGRDGSLALTDKGKDTLFLEQCVAGLRAVQADAGAKLLPQVAAFLLRKGHIAALPEGGHGLTERGSTSLADIEQQKEQKASGDKL